MNNNEMPKMNNNDALELANQMQRRKSSEEEFDDVLEVSEVDLERKRSFANWVLGEAKKHEDYLEFYEVAENKFFDLLMEKKDIVMGMASSQLVIRKEAIKLAKKENVEFVEATEKIYGILIQYQENDVVNYASRYDNKRTPEQKEIKNKQKKEIKEYFK
ncbi:MAG: hypothetical protein WCK11_04525, partial [Candidatus Falkowbacteria bacterium]